MSAEKCILTKEYYNRLLGIYWCKFVYGSFAIRIEYDYSTQRMTIYTENTVCPWINITSLDCPLIEISYFVGNMKESAELARQIHDAIKISDALKSLQKLTEERAKKCEMGKDVRFSHSLNMEISVEK